ncbi:hypothetical protein [Streptomyces sp. NPDC127066]|uniref:hypothetical protein n=1 Tax=Streptomyces sp. NPDC127066 TaxID=3347125 RepID=UPI00364BAFFA
MEDHEDTVGVPDGDQRRRHRSVTRWRVFGPTCEGDQVIAATVDCERRDTRMGHLAMMPGSSP